MNTSNHTPGTATILAAPSDPGTATILAAPSGILPDPQPYLVQKSQGLWEILCGSKVVREFLTEPVARLHAVCWNAGRQPTLAEINNALAPGNPSL